MVHRLVILSLTIMISARIVGATPAANNDAFWKTFHEGKAQVNGFDMHYVIGGKGDLLVLLHGWPQTWYEWRKVMPVLAQHYTVLAPDLRGLGDSGAPPSAIAFDKNTLASDVSALVKKLGFDKAVVIGHDWGGVVAFDYAFSYPDSVKKLAIIEVTPPDASLEQAPGLRRTGFVPWHFSFHLVKDVPEMLVKGKEREYLTYFYRVFGGPGSATEAQITKSDLDEYVRTYSRPGAMANGFEYYRAVFKDIDNTELFRSKAKLAMPVLAVGGQYSFGAFVEQSLKPFAANVHGKVIANAGHWLAEQQPDELAKLLRDFIESTDK
jgi:pimeloyl-ACP methyl ester carboxylesterase